MWRIPYAYALKVAASVLRTPYGILLNLLSRRFNVAHLFNTGEETGGN
jgi:hypothetical protein